jgi:hypothetical protein
VLRTDPSAELDFYTHIRSLDLPHSEKLEAVLFARTFADLARRVLAARAAQAGVTCLLPPLLAQPALLAWLGGRDGLEQRFVAAAPDSWGRETARLLAALAAWLARVYDFRWPESGSYQVWIGQPGEKALRLFGAPPAVQPPEPFICLAEPPICEALWSSADRPHALIGHYDVHGLAMIALTQRFYSQHGVTSIDGAMSFEWTGDISKLWKRAVPKTIMHEKKYATVVMIDCSVHSRKPEYTRKAVARLQNAPGTRLYVVDHHDDTLLAATEIVAAGANVVLTDVLSCGLTSQYGATELDLMYLGALGDKAPEALLVADGQRLDRLSRANNEFHRWMIHFSPTPKEMVEQGIFPLKPLWDSLAQGNEVEPGLAAQTLGELKPVDPPPLPGFDRCGGLLIVTEKLKTVGRTWYSLLERLMEREDCAYAIALRILDGRRANLLLLNQWKLVDHPPIVCFIPEHYMPRCLGHPSAVWVDIEIGEALVFLDSVAHNLNRYLGQPRGLAETAERLERNIIRG